MLNPTRDKSKNREGKHRGEGEKIPMAMFPRLVQNTVEGKKWYHACKLGWEIKNLAWEKNKHYGHQWCMVEPHVTRGQPTAPGSVCRTCYNIVSRGVVVRAPPEYESATSTTYIYKCRYIVSFKVIKLLFYVIMCMYRSIYRNFYAPPQIEAAFSLKELIVIKSGDVVTGCLRGQSAVHRWTSWMTIFPCLQGCFCSSYARLLPPLSCQIS